MLYKSVYMHSRCIVDAAVITKVSLRLNVLLFFQAEDGIRDATVTGVQTCALPISRRRHHAGNETQHGAFGERLADGDAHFMPSLEQAPVHRSEIAGFGNAKNAHGRSASVSRGCLHVRQLFQRRGSGQRVLRLKAGDGDPSSILSKRTLATNPLRDLERDLV